MGATPQPPRAPVPPPPPRSGSHVVAIVLLVLALTYALSGLIHEIPGRQRSNPAASEEVETQ